MKTDNTRQETNLRVQIGLLFSSPLPWILFGFFIAYLLFFYRPIYENSHHKMVFPNYVPTFQTVGGDLAELRNWSRDYINGISNPYKSAEFFNPPLTVVVYAGIAYLPFSLAFRIATGCTMIFFFFSALLFPLYITGRRSVTPVILLVFAMGLMSYGFQFEIERGQFNIAATGCALLAVFIYRTAPRYRWAAFILITVAIQFKIYPAIYLLLFIKDWSAWRSQWRDFAFILLMNILSLFVLGLPRLIDFLTMISQKMAEPYIWVGNMSAKSFATQAFPGNPSIPMLLILGCFFLCLAGALWFFLARPHTLAWAYLFLACTVGAMIIPAVSHDYKLPILVAPVSILFDGISLSKRNPLMKIARIAGLIICSTAFASTLFSFTNKITIPGVGDLPISILVQNNLPALMVLLVGFAFLVVTQKPDPGAASVQPVNLSSTA